MPALPKALWPADGAMVMSKENKPLVGAFLILTNTPICLVEWVIADPQSVKIERREALKVLIEHLYALGKRKGYKIGYAVVQRESILKSLDELGFSREIRGLTGVIKGL